MKKVKFLVLCVFLVGMTGTLFSQINSDWCPACRTENLVTNGDFSGGPVNSALTPTGGWVPASYLVAEQSWDKSTSYALNRLANVNINPAPPSQAMFIQSSNTVTPTTNIWFQNITITPGTDYVWEFWVIGDLNDYYGPNLVMYLVNGPSIIQISPLATSYIPSEYGWSRNCGTWNSGVTNGTWTLVIRQESGFSYNAVYALDDIYFGPEEDWPKSSSSVSTVTGKRDIGNGTDTDESGNVYVTGTYVDQTSFDGISIDHYNGESGFFLTKYDQCGKVDWVAYSESTSPGPPSYSQGWDVVVDEDNQYVFVTGVTFRNERFFSAASATCGYSELLITAGKPAMFVAQYDFDGCLIAIDKFDYGMEMLPRGIAVNQSNTSLNGTVYVTGTVQMNGKNIFLNEFTPTGTGFTWTWGTFSTGNGSSSANNAAYDVSVNENNEVFVGGEFDETLSFLGGTTLTTSATADAFVAKFTDNTSGAPTLDWIKQGGALTSQRARVTGVFATSSEPYVAGFLRGSLNPGASSFSSGAIFSSGSGNAFFGPLSMTSGQGTLHELEGIGGYCYPSAIESANGQAYITGYYTGFYLTFPTPSVNGGVFAGTEARNFVAMLDAPMSGVSWFNTTDASVPGVHMAQDLAVGPEGDVFTTGRYEGRMEFWNSVSPDQLNSSMGGTISDVFVTRNSPNLGLYRKQGEDNTGEDTDLEVIAKDAEYVAKVYPNPSMDGMFNLTLPEAELAYEVKVYSMVGKLIKRTTVDSGSTRLDLSDAGTGIYIIELENENLHQRMRVVVQ